MKSLEIGKTYRLRRDLLSDLEPTEYVCEFEDHESFWVVTDSGIWVNPENFKVKVLEVAKSFGSGTGVIVEAWDCNYGPINTHIAMSMFDYYEEVEELKKNEHEGQVWSEYNQRWIWC
jgi:hypothetical protein